MNGQTNNLLLLFLFLFCSNFAFGKEPFPKDLKLARTNFAKAKAREKAAKDTIAAASTAEEKLQTQLSDCLEKDKRFEDLMAQFDSLSIEFEQKYKEREQWLNPPAGWLIQQKELRRKWDILASHRNHVEDNYWHSLESDLKLVNKELEKWRRNAKEKKKAIDKEIIMLERKRKKLNNILPSVVDVRLDDNLLAKWTISLADIDKANKEAQLAEKKVLEAYNEYLQIAPSLGPAFVKKVELYDGNKVVYRGEWKNLNPETQKELDEEEAALYRKTLRKKIQEAERENLYMEIALDDNRKERLKLAEEMRAPTRRLEKAAERYSNALLNKVYAQVAIESATVVVEVALTGGAATLARKGPELAERAVLRKLTTKLVNSAKGSRQKFFRVGANAAARKWSTYKALQATGTPGSKDPVVQEVQAVALGETVEGFIGAMALPTLGKSVTGFRKAAGEGAWRRIRAGATSGGRHFFSVKSVKGALTDRANIAGMAGSVAKTVATAHFAAKAQKADHDFWTTYAELSALYKVYYLSLSADYKVWRRLQKQRKQVAAARAIYSGLLWKRRLVVSQNDTLTEGSREGKCVVTFSSPLSAPPQVEFGSIPFRMKPLGSSVSGRAYSGVISRDSFSKSKSELTLSISSGPSNLPYAHIDGNPATPAHMPLDAFQWAGFEKEADENYKIKIKGSGKEPEALSRLIDGKRFTRVYIKRIFKEHEPPKINAKDIPPPKGRLAMFYISSSGKYGSVYKNIHRVGDNRPILGTWNQTFDMTPGTYDIYAIGPLPTIKANSITVYPGRVTKVNLGGYGHFRAISRDGLGKEGSSQVVIKKAGAKEAIIGTWSKELELAPGLYDISFTSYHPDIEHKSFEIKKGCETTVEAYGYGRLHLTMLDGVGKKTSSQSVVRHSASNKEVIGTWNKDIDLPPGTYDVHFTSYTPVIVAKGVQVKKHQQSNVVASGYGRLHLTMLDGVGKKTSSHVVVRHSGSKKEVIGTWNKDIDVPPGDYDIHFTSYEPDIVAKSIHVRKHRQSNVEASGYGRILVDFRDRSGKSGSVHTSVHHRGQKGAFYGTWNSSIDVPPGAYDLHFGTGGDGKWSKGVVVTSKKQTTVTVRP